MIYFINKENRFGGSDMKKENHRRIWQIYYIAVSISIIIAGICLMAACVGIYHSGDQPFSREAVSAAFSPIAAVVYTCLILIIFGFVLALLLPQSSQKALPGKNLRMLLQRQYQRADLQASDEQLRSSIAAEQRSRRLYRRITAAVLCVGSLIFLCYALNGNNFHQTEINTSMVHAMYVLIPCMGLPFCCAIFTAYRNAASMERELALLKQCPKSAQPAATSQPSANPHLLRNCLIAAGIALLAYGFCTGGTADVLTKAVNICTECIGLG